MSCLLSSVHPAIESLVESLGLEGCVTELTLTFKPDNCVGIAVKALSKSRKIDKSGFWRVSKNSGTRNERHLKYRWEGEAEVHLTAEEITAIVNEVAYGAVLQETPRLCIAGIKLVMTPANLVEGYLVFHALALSDSSLVFDPLVKEIQENLHVAKSNQ